MEGTLGRRLEWLHKLEIGVLGAAVVLTLADALVNAEWGRLLRPAVFVVLLINANRRARTRRARGSESRPKLDWDDWLGIAADVAVIAGMITIGSVCIVRGGCIF